MKLNTERLIQNKRIRAIPCDLSAMQFGCFGSPSASLHSAGILGDRRPETKQPSPRRSFMNTAIFEPISTLTTHPLITKPLATRSPEYTELSTTPDSELVGGHSVELTERLQPLVHDGNVALDMRDVKRIDAAGIAALVALYRSARDAGHRFSLTNVPARVAQILAVVGLDGLLVSHNAVRASQTGSRRHRPAA
jgi:anti-anti-sigma factor